MYIIVFGWSFTILLKNIESSLGVESTIYQIWIEKLKFEKILISIFFYTFLHNFISLDK